MTLIEKLIVGVGLVVLILLADHWRQASAYQAGADAARIEMAKQYADAKKVEEDRRDGIERDLRTARDIANTNRQEAEEKYATVNEENQRLARAGAIAMRVRVKPGPVCDVGPGDDRPATAGPPEEKTADIVPETVANILDVAGDSARDVRDYNALLDEYDLTVKACTSKAPAPERPQRQER